MRAQTVPDSLRALLSADLADTVRVQVLNQLASKTFYKNPGQTDSLASLAIELATAIRYDPGLAPAHRYKGISLAIRGNFDEARTHYLQALSYLNKTGNEKDKPGLHYAIGITYAETGQYEKAEASYSKALLLQKEQEDLQGIANTYVGFGNFYKKISQFSNSITYLDSAALIYRELNLPSEMAIVKNNQANAYMAIDNYPKALELAQEALAYNEQEGLDPKIAVNYHTIGAIYGYLEEPEKAEEYYTKSFEMKKKLGMIQGMAFSLSNLGVLHLNLQKYEVAKKTFLNVRSIYDSANLACNLPYADMNLGMIYQQTSIRDSAYYYLKRALRGSEVCLSQEVTATTLVRLGEMYLQDDRSATAEQYFLRALEIGRTNEILSIQAEATSHLYRYYKGHDNTRKALEYLELSAGLEDSLYNEENNRRIARLESKYQFDKDRAVLKEQFEKEKLQQESEVLEQKFLRNTALIVAALLLVFAVVILIFYVKIRNRKKMLSAQNQKILLQNEKLEELNQTNDKLLSLLSHDLRSPLHGMQSVITLWKDALLTREEIEQISDDVEIRIGNLLQLMDNILNWSRNHFSSLVAKKARFNLSRAVNETILLLKPNADIKNIVIRFQPEENLELFADETMLKTVLRNILSNAIKFSHSGGEIDVTTRREGSNIQVIFTDYGIGIPESVRADLFTKEVLSKEGTTNEMGAGIGLFLSKDFIDLHEGKIKIISEEGKGATFIVSIPGDSRSEQ